MDVSLSGLLGLEKAKQREYDIALTDIRVPDMRSLIVLRNIKRINPCLPIVFITGYRTVRSAVLPMKPRRRDSFKWRNCLRSWNGRHKTRLLSLI